MSSLLRSLNTLMQIQCKLLKQRQNEYLKVRLETQAHKECLENFSLQQIRNRTLYEHIVTPFKGMQIPESGKFLLGESRIP